MVRVRACAMALVAMLTIVPITASAEPSQTDSLTECVYVDFDCERPAGDGVVKSTLAWAALDGALANGDIEAALGAFTDDAAVDDYSLRVASGYADIRQWLLLHAFPEFHEHVVGTLRVSVDHVSWMDLVVAEDGRLIPVQMGADLRDGKILTLTGTALVTPPRTAGVDPPQHVDFATPLLVTLLGPLTAFIVLPMLLRYATRPRLPLFRQRPYLRPSWRSCSATRSGITSGPTVRIQPPDPAGERSMQSAVPGSEFQRMRRSHT